jgi:undecaprenyl-phosphate 4-deoxy-4-formamido-L-arabinose transferase
MAESVSVVIPVYNSADSLPELLGRLYPVLTAQGVPFEVLLVNDGSRDHSWDTIRRLAERYPEFRGLDLARNFGQNNAVLCGIRAARSEVVVTLDDDLQHPPEEIPRLLDKLAEGHDVVYGTPERQQHGWWRDGASVLTKVVLRHVMGAETARHVISFRAFRKCLCEAFANFDAPFVSIDVLLSWGTSRFAAVQVRHEPRRRGRSNYNFRRLLVQALNLLTGFSTAPLQLAGLVGLGVTLLGLGAFGFALLTYLFSTSSVPGFLFLVSIITLFSGTQLFALGVIGEYLARMFHRTMERPSYVVRSRVEAPRRAA